MAGEPRLCVDIDNVLAQTDSVMREVIRACTDGRVDLAYEDVTHFDYHKCSDAKGCSISKAEWDCIHDEFSEPRHVASSQPAEGCRAALENLAGTYELHLVTSRLRKAWGATVDWLQQHDIPADALHFVGYRQKHVALGEFAAAIEDDYAQGLLFAQADTPCYLVEHPWNRSRPKVANLTWVSGWQEIVEALL